MCIPAGEQKKTGKPGSFFTGLSGRYLSSFIKSSLDTPQLGWGEESEFAEGEAVERIG
jgi:hypothetical protein